MIQAFFHLPLEEHRLGLRWPLFQQLLAFAPPAQTATLITSIGKRLHAALDAGASATAAAAAMAPSVQGGGEVEPPRGMAIDVLLAFVTLTPTKSLAGALGCDASGDDGRGGDGCSGNDDAPAPAPPPAPHPHARRVRLLFSHVLHRWLPALSRALRRPETLNKAFVMAIIMPHTMCWLQQALLSLLRLEAKAAPCASASASASASVSTRADTTSGHGASGDSTSGDIISAAASATAAATAAASAAAATAAATVTATARAVAATAAAASWRQLLLHDIELVPLLETGLRLLAVTRLGYPLADDSAFLVCGVLSALTLAAPDALAPVLLRDAGSPPAPGLAPNDSPWHPDWLRAVVLRHRPADAALHRLLRDLESLRRDAAVAAAGAAAAGLGGGGGGAALHSTFLGGPVARADAVFYAERAYPWAPLSPYDAAMEAAALAAEEATATAPVAACGSVGGAGVQEAPPPAHALRCCANPRCVNLGGESEADLPLQACGGCGLLRYCGRACQAAHWRAGHKEACCILKRSHPVQP